jgi:hypothetical protein
MQAVRDDPRTWPEHYCEDGKHATDTVTEVGYGSAVNTIRKAPTGRWWGISVWREYASPIKFCPYCGEFLK